MPADHGLNCVASAWLHASCLAVGSRYAANRGSARTPETTILYFCCKQQRGSQAYLRATFRKDGDEQMPRHIEDTNTHSRGLHEIKLLLHEIREQDSTGLCLYISTI